MEWNVHSSITPLSATVVVGPTGRERYTRVEPHPSTFNPNNSSTCRLKHPSTRVNVPFEMRLQPRTTRYLSIRTSSVAAMYNLG